MKFNIPSVAFCFLLKCLLFPADSHGNGEEGVNRWARLGSFSSQSELDLESLIEPNIPVAVVGSTKGEFISFNCDQLCDVLSKSLSTCQQAIEKDVSLGQSREELATLCQAVVWKQLAEKEFILTLSGHQAAAGEAWSGKRNIQRTNNWFETTANYLPHMFKMLSFPIFGSKAPALKLLEIGAYEGGSTIFFQRFLLGGNEQSRLTVIDPWMDMILRGTYMPCLRMRLWRSSYTMYAPRPTATKSEL